MLSLLILGYVKLNYLLTPRGGVIPHQDINYAQNYSLELNNEPANYYGWFSTCFYSFIYLVLNTLIFHLLFLARAHTVFFLLMQFTIMVAVVFFIFIYKLTGGNAFYDISREIKDFIQSPLPVMIIAPLFFILKKSKK
jgi:hypothetical protein